MVRVTAGRTDLGPTIEIPRLRGTTQTGIDPARVLEIQLRNKVIDDAMDVAGRKSGLAQLLPKVGVLLPEVRVLKSSSPPRKTRISIGPTGIPASVPLRRIVVPRICGAHRPVKVPDRTGSDFPTVRFIVMLVVVSTQAEAINIHREGVQPMMSQPRKVIDVLREMSPGRGVGPIGVVEGGIKFIKMISQPGRLGRSHFLFLRKNPTKRSHGIDRESSVSGIKPVLFPEITTGDFRLGDTSRTQALHANPIIVALDLLHKSVDAEVISGVGEISSSGVQEDLYKARSDGIFSGFVTQLINQRVSHQCPVEGVSTA